jgi:nucleotidyltransferase/DNA polymerase involved in DNA repair
VVAHRDREGGRGVTVRTEPVLPRLLLVECAGLEEPDEDDGGEHLRRFGRVVDALSSVCPWVDAVRPGVCTLPIKGPTRYFGTEEAVLARVVETVTAALDAAGAGVADTDGAGVVRLGVAEGVFAAALAARTGTVVPTAETAQFLAPWPVDTLCDPELAEVLVRLGLSTLGRFAAVPTADVLARFGAGGVRGHRVARGLDGELPGYRVAGMGARLVVALGRALALQDRQPGFWGGASAADERAGEVLTDLQRRLGTEAVTVPVLEGGRGPADRCRLVPWSPAAAAAEHKSPRRKVPPEPPWPGRLPPPAPAQVTEGICTIELVDDLGTPVAVTARGLLTGEPARLSIDGGTWTPVAAWSAPWPTEERWWSRARRRAARLQVLTADGTARLLVTERGRWRVEATYD